MNGRPTDATATPADPTAGPTEAAGRLTDSSAGPADAIATARTALEGLAERFEAPAAGHGADLRWGPLYEALSGPHAGYVAAIELMYEGYLLHYRESRALAGGGDDGETALLAGDAAYAEGLRVVAGRGDVVSVRLLARLMSACAFLRDEGLPFGHDDALWAYTVAAMAATGGGGAQGARADAAATLFDEVDEAFRAGRGDQVTGLVAAAAPRLGLAGVESLLAALANEGS